jgi:hypothetical protein
MCHQACWVTDTFHVRLAVGDFLAAVKWRAVNTSIPLKISLYKQHGHRYTQREKYEVRVLNLLQNNYSWLTTFIRIISITAWNCMKTYYKGTWEFVMPWGWTDELHKTLQEKLNSWQNCNHYFSIESTTFWSKFEKAYGWCVWVVHFISQNWQTHERKTEKPGSILQLSQVHVITSSKGCYGDTNRTI